RADRRTDWDNLISFVEVAPGCTLLAYQYQNFNRDNYSGRQLDGFVAIFDNNSWHQRYRSYDLTGTAYNNSISSLKCFCR
ncbi:MAG TPA: hypothetical protein VN132_09805, partial [Bdellovibrio sp.]|nr:hypothetical protein [Bdellovibrio sp.]